MSEQQPLHVKLGHAVGPDPSIVRAIHAQRAAALREKVSRPQPDPVAEADLLAQLEDASRRSHGAGDFTRARRDDAIRRERIARASDES